MAVISLPSSPPPSPACRPSPLARHHITAETAALSPPPLQRPRHHPNRGRYSHRGPTDTPSAATLIPSPPPHPLLPCPLYHLAPTCSTTPPTLVLVPCIYLNAKISLFFMHECDKSGVTVS